MFTKLRARLSDYVSTLLKDDSGRYSLNKSMLFFGWLFVSAFIWKLIVTKQLTESFLVIYCAFISGQHLTSKFLDLKADQNDKP
jgi:hypothetical protein